MRSSAQRAAVLGRCWRSVASPAVVPETWPTAGNQLPDDQQKAFEKTLWFNRMLDVCAKARDVAGAELLFFRMVKDKVEPNDSTYIAVVSACAGACEALRAEIWLRRLVSVGLQPQVKVYTAVVDAHVQVGDVAAAESGLARMHSLALRPHAKKYGELLLACARPGDDGSDFAEKIVSGMRKQGVEPDIRTYSEILSYHALARDWERVDARLKEMAAAGVQPNDVTFLVLVSACAKLKDLPRAEELMARALRAGVTPTVPLLNAMLNVCARAGEVEAAERWLLQIRGRYGLAPDVVSYNSVLHACAQAGDLAAAKRTFERMKRAELAPDVMSYTAVIQACAKCKHGEEAEVWLSRMLGASIPADSKVFNAALHACVQADDVVRLWRIYGMLKDQDVSPNSATYASLAVPYARRGDVDKVETLMRESRSAGYTWQEREYLCLLSAYANAVPRQSQKAERVFRQLVAAGLAPSDHLLRYFRQALGSKRASNVAKELGVRMPRPSGGDRRIAEQP